MPNLSVKLDEAMRQRLHEIAAQEEMTPHALMVRAIGHELDRAEAEGAFIKRGLQARRGVEASVVIAQWRRHDDEVRPPAFMR